LSGEVSLASKPEELLIAIAHRCRKLIIIIFLVKLREILRFRGVYLYVYYYYMWQLVVYIRKLDLPIHYSLLFPTGLLFYSKMTVITPSQ
jgi:hypothetical protein